MVEDHPVLSSELPVDLCEAIISCDLRCEKYISDFSEKIDLEPAPARIYHYTGDRGLLGILESGVIRLTDIFGLNDPSELRYGVKYASEAISTQAKQGLPAIKLFAEIFDQAMDLHIEKIAYFFVACFSLNGDELSQWRAYGDDGRGFALGFEAGPLEKAIIKQEDFPSATFPVTYKGSLLNKIHKQIVREVLSLLNKTHDRDDLSKAIFYKFMEQLSKVLSSAIIRSAILFKHEAYVTEQEYRFHHMRGIHRPVNDLGYFVRNSSLVRFAKFDWKTEHQNTLREIIIGPAANEENTRSFIQKCLLNNGFDPEKIITRQSKIPYRSN